MDDLLRLLKSISRDGLPAQLVVIDDSTGSGVESESAYLDLIDTVNDDAPYRIIIEGPEVHS